MAEGSSSKFCVICGEEDLGQVGVGDSVSDFSKDVNFAKFCAELELSSGLSEKDMEFTAFRFLNQLDACSELVKVCEICSVLISETVDKTAKLEGLECEVLELQIKLLLKLKELEGCTQLYFREMRKIVERVKGSQLNGLEWSVFGEGNGKCDVLGFRERILNVATSQAIFQGILKAKLCRGRRKQETIPEEIQDEMEWSPTPTPPVRRPSIHESSNDFDNPSISSPPPLSPDLDDNDNDKEQALEEFKMDTDTVNDDKDDYTSKQNQPVSTSRRYPSTTRQQAKITKDKLSQVNWSEMGPLKSKLIKNIITYQRHPSSSTDELLKIHQWNYLAPTDQVQFGGYPIQVTESEDEKSMSFSCSSCGGDPNYNFSFDFPPYLTQSALTERITRGILVLKRNISDHVLSSHLNAFNCSKCSEDEWKKLNITSLSKFRAHMNQHSGKVYRFCEYCGKTFRKNKELKAHVDRHLMENMTEEEVEKFKKYQCDTCGKKYHRLKHLHAHEEQHKPKDERVKIKCSFCGKEVLKRCYLTHKKYYCPQQSKNENLQCYICGKRYKNGKSLGDHLVRTHRLPERPKKL